MCPGVTPSQVNSDSHALCSSGASTNSPKITSPGSRYR